MLIHRKIAIAGLTVALMFCASPVRCEDITTIKSGLALKGSTAELPKLNKNPFAAAGGGVKARPIIVIDDGLREMYMHRRGMVVGEPGLGPGIARTIEFDFKKPIAGRVINGIGPLLQVSPFNKYGRRVVVVRGADGGNLTLVQGIAELNARYAILYTLKDKPAYDWVMRLATSKLSSDTLRAIFAQRINNPNLPADQVLDMRLEHVRFFIEAERFADARIELVETLKQFPNRVAMKDQLGRITELQFSQLIREAQKRAEIGQVRTARDILERFPLELVGRVTRLEVKDAIAKLDKDQAAVDDVLDKLSKHVGQLKPNEITEIKPLMDEIKAGLSLATLSRMGDYLRLAGGEDLPLDSRVALGISGWLLGSGEGIQNLSVALSLIKVRNLVREYLASDDEARRKKILEELANLEGSQPDYISRMLPLMEPPKPLPAEAEHPTISGMYAIASKEPDGPRYVVQLPPDYDPLREYPCIVALNPPRSIPETEVDWWAGFHNPKLNARGGHATRHGYVVIAPAWTRPGQSDYEYTAPEHQRVLVAMRDAMRRISIDSDRVFIAGHGPGGTAAWDIAVSHPDLWAGMIAISCKPGKTITHYFPNAEHVPIYVVNGQLDRVLSENNHAFSSIMDDYVNVRADAMWVKYKGWGYSLFFEEINHLFDWMNVKSHRRKEIPQELDNVTMRKGDEFFWWLELDGMKKGTAIDPVLWSQAKRIRAKLVEANIGAANNIRISQGPTDRFIVWLRPDMGIDLNKRVTVRYGSRSIFHDYDREIVTMLEDARQRADRKRPFWTKIVVP